MATPRLRLHLGIRAKLVLISLLILMCVSFGFTALNFWLSRGWVDEDLRERAIAFTREVAVSLGERDLERTHLVARQIRRVMAVRQTVLQLDVLALDPQETRVVATSHPQARLPFTRADATKVRAGEVVARLGTERTERYWEVMAPVRSDDAVVGAVAAKFSLGRADALAARSRRWALGLTAASVLVMGLLMTLAVDLTVNRPVRRLMDAIARVQAGDTLTTVRVDTDDEFGVLAGHFNRMIGRLHEFNDELQRRVKEATAELEQRYQEVERLNALLFGMQRTLSHAERLAVAGRLLAQVAHEVGTPLHSVAGHLELLRRDLPATGLSPDVNRRLGVVEEQVARVTQIISQLLDMSRRDPGDAEPVDLNGLVGDTVDLVRPGVAAAGLGLSLATEPALPPVPGHRNQLQQVILNLLTNAIDATPAGGRLDVVTGLDAGRGEVVLAVSDTGRGIPPEHRKEIFEPFFTTKQPGRGTGLGLFISNQIVRDHRGRIEVDSEVGRGSTFRVLLPLSRRTA